MKAKAGVCVLLVLAALLVSCRSDDELEVKVRTDFAAGDQAFENGLNEGISNAKMKKDFEQNAIVITFDFDVAKIKSDPRRSAGLLYRFYDENGRPMGHRQVDWEMTQLIITAQSGGTRDGTVTHAIDMESLDPVMLRAVDKATIGFLGPHIRW